jgi:hypothetical protein
VRAWIKKGCIVCAATAVLGLLVVLAVGGLFLLQSRSLDPEERQLAQAVVPAPGEASIVLPGKVVLSLSSAAVTVEAGPAGEPIRVESDFDPEVHRMEQSFSADEGGSWVYRLDFHEKRLLHVSVFSVWMGKRSPEVRVVLPRDLLFALEGKMTGGYLTLDLAGLALTDVDLELDRGVFDLDVSEPLPLPLERMSVRGRIGTTRLLSLGNASPQELYVQHGLGFAQTDLSGEWMNSAEIEVRVAFGGGELRLPRGVRIEGLDRGIGSLADDAEIPVPTLRIKTHSDAGDIHVVD